MTIKFSGFKRQNTRILNLPEREGVVGNLQSFQLDPEGNTVPIRSIRDATQFGYQATSGGNQALSLGGYSTATGDFSVAVGYRTRALGTSSVAVGNQAAGLAAQTVAIGERCNATGVRSVAIGYEAATKHRSSVVIGDGASLVGNLGKNAVVIGPDTSGWTQDVVIGDSATGAAQSQVVIGFQASGDLDSGNSIVIGTTASVTSANSQTVIGNGASGSAISAVAYGSGATVSAAHGTAVGNSATVSHSGSTSIGSFSASSGANECSIGQSTTGLGFYISDFNIVAEDEGQRFHLKALTELTTIAAAATTDTTIQIPADAVVFGVSARVTVQPGGTSTFDLGVAGATTRYGTGISTTANTTHDGTDDATRYYSAATAIRITPNATPSDAAGRIRITIHYYEITPPTS